MAATYFAFCSYLAVFCVLLKFWRLYIVWTSVKHRKWRCASELNKLVQSGLSSHLLEFKLFFISLKTLCVGHLTFNRSRSRYDLVRPAIISRYVHCRPQFVKRDANLGAIARCHVGVAICTRHCMFDVLWRHISCLVLICIPLLCRLLTCLNNHRRLMLRGRWGHFIHLSGCGREHMLRCVTLTAALRCLHGRHLSFSI